MNQKFIHDRSLDRVSMLKLRYFLVTAQAEHITKASQILQITQPALSKAISSMESDLGIKLFSRSGSKIVLTSAGKKVQALAEDIISSIEALQESTSNPGRLSGQIRFMTSVICTPLLTELINAFHQKYPGITFDIATMHGYNNSSRAFDIREWDMYLHSTEIPLYQCISVPIFRERLMLGVSKHHPFADISRISLYECRNETFLSLRKQSSYYSETLNLCAMAGFSPNISIFCDHTAICLDLVSRNAGIVIMPEYSWGFVPDTIHLIEIDDADSTRNYYLSRSAKKRLSHVGSVFYDFVLDFYTEFNHQLPDGRQTL